MRRLEPGNRRTERVVRARLEQPQTMQPQRCAEAALCPGGAMVPAAPGGWVVLNVPVTWSHAAATAAAPALEFWQLTRASSAGTSGSPQTGSGSRARRLRTCDGR